MKLAALAIVTAVVAGIAVAAEQAAPDRGRASALDRQPRLVPEGLARLAAGLVAAPKSE